MTKTRTNAIYYLIAACIAATTIIHFSRAMGNPHIRLLFTMNALGYVSLGLLLLAPWPVLMHRRSMVSRILIGYAGLTFFLFFVWGVMKGEWPVIGFVDKGIEILLIIAVSQLAIRAKDSVNTRIR